MRKRKKEMEEEAENFSSLIPPFLLSSFSFHIFSFPLFFLFFLRLFSSLLPLLSSPFSFFYQTSVAHHDVVLPFCHPDYHSYTTAYSLFGGGKERRRKR